MYVYLRVRVYLHVRVCVRVHVCVRVCEKVVHQRPRLTLISLSS